jgi:gamma-glutamyltranspeptidase/glutathione hydrolase
MGVMKAGALRPPIRQASLTAPLGLIAAMACAMPAWGDGGAGLAEPEPHAAVDACSAPADDGPALLAAPGVAGDPAGPEAGSGYRPGRQARYAATYMVVANTPLAARAGCEILRAGGSAVDAAVAVQVVLGLVEPQSSSIAGSAFMLYYDARRKKVSAYDGRETAPAAATAHYLTRQNQSGDYSPPPLPSARRSGRSIGVPAVMRMLELAHAEHGALRWNRLFDSGIRLADGGFPIPARLGDAIAHNADALALDANAVSAYFDADHAPRRAGATMTNRAYADTLRALAERGADALYRGPIAERLIAKARQAVGDDAAKTPITPSLMTLDDLAAYRAKKREPVCTRYRGAYTVCGMPPPSSGGAAVAQALGMLAHFDLSQDRPAQPGSDGGVPGAQGVHLVSEAERLAYADRDRYVADTDFAPLPGGGLSALLDGSYLRRRAALISPARSLGTAPAGWLDDAPRGVDRTTEHGTTHFSIVDASGNVVTMTSSVESSMGSFHMVDGFLLSNLLTDFSAAPADGAGRPIANRIEPGKRPRSTMAPTLVFRGNATDDFVLATGSPGGGAIPLFVLKTLVGVLDWDLDAQQAASLVNFGTVNGPTTLVDGSNPALDLDALTAGLRERGHKVTTVALPSGIATIRRVWKDGKTLLEGGADPRREGVVLGDGAR